MKLLGLQTKGWKDYLEEFLLEKRLSGLRERTLFDYSYYVNRFFNGYDGELSDFGKLKRRVQEFFSEDLAPATFNLRRAYLKAFFNFLVEAKVIPENPITFKRRKTEGRARAIPKEVLKRLLELPNRRTFTGLRNFVLILLSLDTGIRPSEALSLVPDDFNLTSREVKIPADVAKTKVSRTIPISTITALWVKRLLSVRPKEWSKDVPVFCSCLGEPLKPESWARILKNYSKKLGYRITPYDLRHSFALISLREGMNPFTLQRILGHADLTMTKRYLALTQEDLKKGHEEATPVKLLIKKGIRKIPV